MQKTRVWAIAALAVFAVAFAGMQAQAGQEAAKPSRPITINLVDVGGAMAFTKEGFERYAADNPAYVSRFAITQAPAPELPGKLLAMQRANRSDIDLVVGGLDIMAAGIELGLWEQLFPAHQDVIPGILEKLVPPAKDTQALTQGYGMQVGYMVNGPYPMFNPTKVPNPPTTPAELLEWCKANPNRFIYARPANSGPARAFIMGLPYMLGDKDPKDPTNGWEKTWAYLEELGQYVEYYPTGTGALMKELGEGSRDMTITTTGWDINPRALGIVPKETAIVFFKDMTFVSDCQFMMVPKNLSPERLAVVLDIVNYMVQPEQQALTWDLGYFYPGPVIDVPLSMAPQSSQDCMAEFGRPEYETIAENFPIAVPLNAKELVDAFRIWDERVGSKK